MPRQVILFTGSWADLSLDELVTQVAEWGYQGVDLCCWGDHFEVQMAQRDKAGKIIGALAVVFPYKEGMDKEQLHAKGEEIRKEIEAQVPTLAKLFETAK